MPEDDDALKRRLQAYFSGLEGESLPPGIERLPMPAEAPRLSWRERYMIPAIAVGVASVILIVIVVAFLPGRRNEGLDVGESIPPPSRPPSTTSTTLGTTRPTSGTAAPTLATAPSTTSTTAAPTTSPPSSTSSTSAPSSSIPSGQLFSDDFASAQIGSVPLGWTVDSGTWSVVQSGNGKALQGSTPKGQEGRISNGSASWTDVKVSASVRRDETNTIAGVAARYQSASNHYFCKIDGGQVALGKLVGDKGSILSSSKVNIAQGQVVTIALTVKGNALQCTVNGAGLTSANDGTFASGRMALVQDGTATFGNVVVTAA